MNLNVISVLKLERVNINGKHWLQSKSLSALLQEKLSRVDFEMRELELEFYYECQL